MKKSEKGQRRIENGKEKRRMEQKTGSVKIADLEIEDLKRRKTNNGGNGGISKVGDKGTSRAAYATNNKYNFSGRTVLRKAAETSSDLTEEPSIGWRMGAVDD